MKTALAAVVASLVVLSQVHAAEIDGATNPELISDDLAFHLVLLSASALESEPEVEKARARSAVETILFDNADYVSALAEIANRYRSSLAGLTTDAARLDLLVSVRNEIDTRLSRRARRALNLHVREEKANMQIHGTPPPPGPTVFDLDEGAEPTSELEPLAHCPGGGGGLAPYCRDGCSGSRPLRQALPA